MFFKTSYNQSRQSPSHPTQPSNSRPSSFNKENVFNRFNNVTPVESRLSLQSINKKSLNRSSKFPIQQRQAPISNQNHKLLDFLKKVSNYLTISNVLIQEAESLGNTSGTLLRQIKKLGDKIELQMQEYKGLSSQNESPEQIQWRTINDQLLKRINELQSEVGRLEVLVDHHQDNNLKMMIKMNQNESGNISYFKTQLEESFQAYKLLQDKVQIYKQKLKQAQNIKCLVQRDNQKKTETIIFLQKQLIKTPKDRRASLNESKGIKGMQKKPKQKSRYAECSMVNSITNSVIGNNQMNGNMDWGNNNSNSYLRCANIQSTELQDFISH